LFIILNLVAPHIGFEYGSNVRKIILLVCWMVVESVVKLLREIQSPLLTFIIVKCRRESLKIAEGLSLAQNRCD